MFAGIDLDHASGDADVYQRQVSIEKTFASYSKLSPSGRGLHIIVEDAVPNGRRRAKVESYSTDRSFTMTGNVFRDAPIQPRHELLNTLWVQMGGATSVEHTGKHFRQAVESDEAVFERAAALVRGQPGLAASLHQPRSTDAAIRSAVVPTSLSSRLFGLGIASEVMGRTVHHLTISDAAWREERIAAGTSPMYADMLLGTFRAARNGAYSATEGALADLLGRPPVTIQDVLRARLS